MIPYHDISDSIDGHLTFKQMLALIIKLYMCASMIPTTMVGGTHKNLGLIMDAALYVQKLGEAWNDPINHGLIPDLPNATNQIDQQTMHDQHQERMDTLSPLPIFKFTFANFQIFFHYHHQRIH